MSKYIDSKKLIAEIERLHKAHSGKYGCDEVALNLEYLEDFITSLQQEQESVAERFARIVRENLIGIDKEVQQKFEQLYFEVTGNKMYGGYND